MTKWSELQTPEAFSVISSTLDEWFRGTHYANILIRRNGKDEKREADWLKHVPGVLARYQVEREEMLAFITHLLDDGIILPNESAGKDARKLLARIDYGLTAKRTP